MRKHLFIVAVVLLGLWNIRLQAQVFALAERALAGQDVAFASPVLEAAELEGSELEAKTPVAMSPPYDPAWDADDTDDRSAYERSRDAKLAAKAAALPTPSAPGDWGRSRDQGCRLARMGISEDTRPLRRIAGGGTEGKMTADHHGIANVVRNNLGRLLLRRHRLKGKVRNWTQVMGELSPHVNRVVELKKGKPRQVWTSSLPCEGDAKPEGWDLDPQAGDWEVARMFWPGFRDDVTSRWLTNDFTPVPGKPIGWGSMSGDIPNALGRGMVLVPWGDGRNGFVRWPRKDEKIPQVVAVLSADVAAGAVAVAD